MERKTAKIGDLKEGNYVIINEEPCVITKKSTPTGVDKEEDAKEKVYVEGLFDGQKRTFVESIDSEVEVPVIEEGDAQILAIIGKSAQLMDLSTYETFEVTIPLELQGEVEEGDEIEYIQALSRKKIERKK